MFAGIKKLFEKNEEPDKILYNNLIQAIQEKNTIEAKTIEALNLIKQINNTSILNKAVDAYGNTVLILAADAGLREVCMKLIPKMNAEGISAIETEYNQSALVKAMWRDLDNVCIKLIPKTSPEAINAIDIYGNTLLMLAARKGMKTVFEKLIERMESNIITHVNNEGDTAASLADCRAKFTNEKALLQKRQEEQSITQKHIEISLRNMTSELATLNRYSIENISNKIKNLGDNPDVLKAINKNLLSITDSIKVTNGKFLQLVFHLDTILAAQEKPLSDDISTLGTATITEADDSTI